MVANLLEEADQVATIVKSVEGSDSSEGSETKETLAADLSNLMYTLFILAEHYGIELEDSFLQTVNDMVLSRLS